MLLEKDSFFSSGLTEVKELNVFNCRLRAIELGVLKGLKKLTELVIRSNEISEILPGTFESLSNLEKLDLRYNRLENLDSDLFTELFNLKSILLGGNKLQYLHPDTFLMLPNLNHISLQNNSDLQIPTDGHFITSHSLLSLDISLCNVSSVSVETFANVSALNKLILSENNLRSVDVNILKSLPELKVLYLYGNPLHCDCPLQELWRWCKDRAILTGLLLWLVPLCHTPREVKGRMWGVVEMGQCLGGSIKYNG
jgi:Leucine-rich repeat (LRR) protein